MPAKIYYDQDADLSLLKNKTIAILGYGSQGHAQAQNLHNSGCKVIIAELPGSTNYKLAVEHGFQPLSAEEATKKADLINILLPDEIQGDVYRQHIMKQLQPGNVLMCSTASTSTSVRSNHPRVWTHCWWPPRAPDTWCAASSSKVAACPAWWR